VSDLPTINGDEASITLLFQNLIANAIKFRLATVPPRIIISAQKEAHYWKFSVADNGIGIEPQYQEKIFEACRRLHSNRRYEGSGIGLTHSKKIVESHGGKIWVESALEKGSVFHFTIPAGL